MFDGEEQAFDKLERVRRGNFDVLELYSRLLNHNPRVVKAADVKEITTECAVSEEYAYYALLTAAFNLDTEGVGYESELAGGYILPSVKRLNTAEFKENPYYANIKVPKVEMDGWKLDYEQYASYEAFICGDICVSECLKEVPQLGFFGEEFRFPCVYEGGREWMAVKPNEIATMSRPIALASGDVVTFGLGLGYYTYMVSEKDDVKSVTVVERDKRVIRLFKDYILPQFKHAEKVKIVTSDAFDYAENMQGKGHDFAFVDLWHDASDGLETYLKMKKIEVLNPDCEFCYWIEDTLLSYLRWREYDKLYAAYRGNIADTAYDAFTSADELYAYLSNDNLKKLAANL